MEQSAMWKRGGGGVAAMLVWAFWMATACTKSGGQTVQPPPPPQVTVAHPVVRDATEWDYFTGRLAATDEVQLRPQVTGTIVMADFKEGSYVEAGTVLFQIDPVPYKAAFDSAQGNLLQAKAKRELAKADLARAQKVAAAGVVSAEELDTRRANVEQADGGVVVAEAAVDDARHKLEWTQVKAPISGVVDRKLVTAGNLVTAQQTLLTTVTKLNPIYCLVEADEGHVRKYQRLAEEKRRVSARDAMIPCQMQLSDESTWRDGHIDFVGTSFTPGTGTLLGRGVFPNPDRKMQPGSFARFRVTGRTYSGAMLVTEEAVGTEQNSRYVLVVGPENKVEQRVVKVGPLIEGMRVIEEGLSAEDWVIVNGMVKARPNSVVSPIRASAPGGVTASAPTSSTATAPGPEHAGPPPTTTTGGGSR